MRTRVNLRCLSLVKEKGCHSMLCRNIYAVLATVVGCEQPSQRVVLTFLARGFVTLCV